MAKFLSPEWLALRHQLSTSLPEVPGASARAQYVVTGAPGGEVHYHATVDDGRYVELALGDDPRADFTAVATHDVAVAILKCELDPAAAFMRGTVKITGNMGKVMALLPLTQSPEYGAVQSELAAQTEL